MYSPKVKMYYHVYILTNDVIKEICGDLEEKKSHVDFSSMLIIKAYSRFSLFFPSLFRSQIG